MQHNRAGRKLGRTTPHRRAMFRNQLASLFTHERIETTLPKAKDLRPLAEKLVTLAKSGSLHARRLALKSLPDKDAVKRLFDEIAPRFKERPGGYTRIMKLGKRQGDGAEVAIIEFVDYDYSQRQADKVIAQKAATEKKETLVEKAKRLLTGKGAEKTEAKEGETTEAADEATAGKAKPKAAKKEKTVKPKAEPKPRTSGPKGPTGSGPKGGGRSATPRKVGGGG